MLGGESLANYYQTNFTLIQVLKISLDTLEDMLPFERNIYITLLNKYLEERKNALSE